MYNKQNTYTTYITENQCKNTDTLKLIKVRRLSGGVSIASIFKQKKKPDFFF